MHNIFDEHMPFKYFDNRMTIKGQNDKNAHTAFQIFLHGYSRVPTIGTKQLPDSKY